MNDKQIKSISINIRIAQIMIGIMFMVGVWGYKDLKTDFYGLDTRLVTVENRLTSLDNRLYHVEQFLYKRTITSK